MSTAPNPTLPQQIVVGGLATSMACFFTNPIEVVKTRLQLQNELTDPTNAKKKYRNPFHAFRVIIQEEGAPAIQKGLAPGVCYQFVCNGLRLGCYEFFKKELNLSNQSGYFGMMGLAAGSGAFGAACASPFFMVKVRLQSQVTVGHMDLATAVGTQHSYEGMLSAFRSVWKERGIRGLFQGVEGAIPRVMVGSSVQLPSYDLAKDLLRKAGLKDGIPMHMSASMIAGLVITLAMNPFDVVSTRLYNQQIDGPKGSVSSPPTLPPGASNPSGVGVGTVQEGKRLYTGPLDCFVKIAKTEGFMGFYKGFLAHYLRLGPHTILGFVFWEQFKRLFKLVPSN